MSVIKEMRSVCQLRKQNSKGEMVWAGQWSNRIFTRHFSIYITWLFVRFGVSANTVTFLMIPSGLIGVLLCIPHVLWINILGVILIVLAQIFDCVDGEIARWVKKTSLKGVYLDHVTHVLCNGLLFTMCALHLFVLTEQVNYLVLAFVTYFAAQSSHGLRDVYKEICAKNNSGKSSRSQFSTATNFNNKKGISWIKKLLVQTKFLISMFTDTSVVSIVSFVCIFFSYAGITIPLVFFSLFFAIFLITKITGEIISKFFFRISDIAHNKEV